MASHDYVRNTDKDVLGEKLHQIKGQKNEYPMFQQWLLRQYETLFLSPNGKNKPICVQWSQ